MAQLTRDEQFDCMRDILKKIKEILDADTTPASRRAWLDRLSPDFEMHLDDYYSAAIGAIEGNMAYLEMFVSLD